MRLISPAVDATMTSTGPMLPELPTLFLIAILPLWVVAVGSAARRLRERRQIAAEQAAELEAGVAEAVVALSWAFELEVEREGAGVEGLTRLRGAADGQRFELALTAAGWAVSVELQPALPPGLRIHAIDGRPLLCAQRQALGERGATGHGDFDRHYFVDAARQASASATALPPRLVEALAREPVPGLSLDDARFVVERAEPCTAGRSSDLIRSLRGLLALARSIEAASPRRPLRRRAEGRP